MILVGPAPYRLQSGFPGKLLATGMWTLVSTSSFLLGPMVLLTQLCLAVESRSTLVYVLRLVADRPRSRKNLEPSITLWVLVPVSTRSAPRSTLA